MKKIIIYGENPLSLFLANKLLTAKYEVLLILPKNKIPSTQIFQKRILNHLFESNIGKNFNKLSVDIVFICEKIQNNQRFVDCLENIEEIVWIDTLVANSTDKFHLETKVAKNQIVKAFTNFQYRLGENFSGFPKDESFYCTDNPIYINKFKILSYSIGIKSIYAGPLKNEKYLLALRTLNEEIQKHSNTNQKISLSTLIY